MPQLQYGEQPLYRAGQRTKFNQADVDVTRLNPLEAQSTDIPVGGTTDGTYTVQLDGEAGTFSFSFVAAGNTAAQIASGLEAAALANTDLSNILSPSVVTNTLTLDFLHPGEAWAITFPSNPGTNLSASNTQDAGGVNLRPGIFVARGTDSGEARAPNSGDLDADILGVVGINENSEFNAGPILMPVTTIEPGDNMAVCIQGCRAVELNGTAADGDPVHLVIDSAGGQAPGSVRSTADGGNTILLTSVYFDGDASGSLASVRLNRP